MVTFTISETKKGYGIYLKSLSGIGLKELLYKLPEISNTVSFDIATKLPVSAIPVKSDRLYLYPTLQGATNRLAKINLLTELQKVDLVRRLYFKAIEKNYVIGRVQSFSVVRDFLNREISYSTIDKKRAEEQLSHFGTRGLKARIHPTVARNLKLTHDQHKKISQIGEMLPAIPKGARKSELRGRIITRRK